MSDTNNRPKQDGSLRGQNTGPLPNRGSSTGVTDSYGADLGFAARNRKGSVSADSDPVMQDTPHDPQDFSSKSHSDPSNGKGFSADSDPVNKKFNDNARI